MDDSKRLRLGELQLEILKALWQRGEASVGEVHESVSSDAAPLAYTTVATMLRKMEARQLVAHRSEGRKFIYRAEVAEQDVSRDMATDVLERAFEGSLSSLVQHLLTTRDVSRDELRRLEELIEERKGT